MVYIVTIAMNGVQFFYSNGFETTTQDKATRFTTIGDAMRKAVELNSCDEDKEMERQWQVLSIIEK